MPVHYSSSSSKSNKSKGFSIDDLIQNDPTLKMGTPLPHATSYLPSMVGWFPTANTMLHFQRQSMLHYLRQTPNFAHSDPSATAFLLNSFRKPKRNRTAFTPAQLLKLEDAFEKNHYIVGEERKQLARLLNLSETKVKVWYQNRRTKQKRLIVEDATGSMNESDHHRRPSETSDTPTNKLEDECSSSDDSYSQNNDQATSI